MTSLPPPVAGVRKIFDENFVKQFFSGRSVSGGGRCGSGRALSVTCWAVPFRGRPAGWRSGRLLVGWLSVRGRAGAVGGDMCTSVGTRYSSSFRASFECSIVPAWYLNDNGPESVADRWWGHLLWLVVSAGGIVVGDL